MRAVSPSYHIFLIVFSLSLRQCGGVMIDKNHAFQRPSRWQKPDGSKRVVGFEFEFAGAGLDACVSTIQDLFGGSIQPKHSMHAQVVDTQLGDFTVELDAAPLQKLADKLETQHTPDKHPTQMRQQISQFITEVSMQVVPMEITTSPLSFEQLPELEKLRSALQAKQAKGTKTNITHAFGMHINPEIPSQQVQSSVNMLKAFLLLYPWLLKLMEVDYTRRLLTYIKPFSTEYLEHILTMPEPKNWQEFAEDYVTYNPTRNRALDFLPLLAHMCPEIADRLDEHNKALLKPRPAYHYRLPNCEINDPDWTIARDWNYWVQVEELACHQDKLDALIARYLVMKDQYFMGAEQEWVKYLEQEYFTGDDGH